MTALSLPAPSSPPVLFGSALPLNEAAALVLRRALAGGGAVLAGEAAKAVLDAAADGLGGVLPVLRVDARGGLGVSGFMAAITGQSDLSAHDDAVLERGFRALATPGGVVLLVDGADGLKRPVLRCLELACCNAPALRVVLAGTPALPALLDGLGLQTLCLRTGVSTPIAVGSTPAPAPRAPLSPHVRKQESWRLRGWATAALGSAGATALGTWIAYATFTRATAPLPTVTVETMLQVAAVVPRAVEATRVPAAQAAPRAAEAEPAAEPSPSVASATLPSPAPGRTTTADAAPGLSVAKAGSPLPPPSARTARRAEAKPRDATPALRRPARRDENMAYADPRGGQPQALSPPYTPVYPSSAFIGTYSVNPDGTRAFRMER